MNNTKRVIYKLDITNNILSEYESLKSAYETFNGIKYKSGVLAQLSMILNLYHDKKISRKYKGYFWCFKEDYEKNKDIHKQFVNNNTSVIQKEIKTEKIIKKWESIMDASEFYSKINNCSVKRLIQIYHLVVEN